MSIPIVLTAFGTTAKAFETYGIMDEIFQEKFKENPVLWAYSSRMVKASMKKNKKIDIKDPGEVLEELKAKGHEWAVVQSLHLICGHEFDRLVTVAEKSIIRTSMGLPLLTSAKDYMETAEVLKDLGYTLTAIVDTGECALKKTEIYKPDIVLSGSVHGLTHGRDIGIKPRANILDIENQSVDADQHVSCRAAVPAIQTDDIDSGGGIPAVIYYRDILRTNRTVLGAEQRDEINFPGFMQKLDGAASLAVDTCLVGDQSDMSALELFETIPVKYIDATQGSTLSGAHNSRRQADGCCDHGQQGKSQQAFGPETLLCRVHSDNFLIKPVNTHYTDKQHGRPH